MAELPPPPPKPLKPKAKAQRRGRKNAIAEADEPETEEPEETEDPGETEAEAEDAEEPAKVNLTKEPSDDETDDGEGKTLRNRRPSSKNGTKRRGLRTRGEVTTED